MVLNKGSGGSEKRPTKQLSSTPRSEAKHAQLPWLSYIVEIDNAYFILQKLIPQRSSELQSGIKVRNTKRLNGT